MKYSLGVSGVVISENKVLLVRRMHEPYRGRWTIPGGYVEDAEPVDEAARREIVEETGLATRVVGAVGVRHRISNDDSNLVVIFLMSPESGEPVPDGTEVDAARYWPVSEALADPCVIEMSKLSIRAALEADKYALMERSCEPTPLIGTTKYLLYCLDQTGGQDAES